MKASSFYPRTAVVTIMEVDNVGDSSILNVGDVFRFSAKSNVFALQREHPFYYGDEAPLSMFPIYSEPIPYVKPANTVRMNRVNQHPFIYVYSIRVIGVATASSIIIGSCAQQELETRVLHIRHFIEPPEELEEQTASFYPVKNFTGITL